MTHRSPALPTTEHNQLAKNLTQYQNRVLSDSASDSPQDLFSNIVLFEDMRTLLGRYREVKGYVPRASLADLERLLREQHERLSPSARRWIVGKVRRYARRHIRGVKSANRKLRSRRLPESMDYAEYYHDVIHLREMLEYSFPMLSSLGYDNLVTSLRKRFKSIDRALERLSREGTIAYYKDPVANEQAAHPGWFPESFWWRRVAWEAYLRVAEGDGEGFVTGTTP